MPNREPEPEPDERGYPGEEAANEKAARERAAIRKLTDEVAAAKALLHLMQHFAEGRVRPAAGQLRKSESEETKVLFHAVETFGSQVNAWAWLKEPNRVFHNQTPLQILTEDPTAVEEELVRIDHGMFI